jgi:hypothetical protein
MRPGRYMYNYETNEHGEYVGESASIVDAPTATAEGWVQHAHSTSNRGGGYAETSYVTIVYTAAGVHQQRLVVDETLNGIAYNHRECTNRPDDLIIPTGVRLGDTWTITTTCTDTLQGTWTQSARLTDNGLEQVRVGAQFVWSVHISYTWSGNLLEVWSLPANGMDLKGQIHSSSFSASSSAESTDPAG